MKRYGIASGLVGFKASTLRVIIDRVEGAYAWVTTADLRDAGTPLVLDASQVTEPAATFAGSRYTAGFVTFAG